MYYKCMTLFGQTPAPVDMVNIFRIKVFRDVQSVKTMAVELEA